MYVYSGVSMKRKWRLTKITPMGNVSTAHFTKVGAKTTGRTWLSYREAHKMKGGYKVEKIPKELQW